MNCINNIIIKADEAYNNTVKFGDIEVVVNSTIESAEHVNRIVEVISAPKDTILKSGDKVVIHHNVLKLRNGVGGMLVQSDYLIKDNLYFVPFDLVYAYKRGEEDWRAITPHVFIKPIDFEFDENESSLTLNKKEYSYKGKVKNRGIVKYLNEELEEYGVKVGDEIYFTDDSEYEFKINDEVLYLMRNVDVLAVIH